MTLLLDAPNELRGSQLPRVYSYPPYPTTAGQDAIDLAQLAGLDLDEWQQFVLLHSLGESAAWKCPQCPARSEVPGWICPDHLIDATHPWASFEVGVCVPRQNGKGGILEARELAGLFLFGERLIIHTAHESPTSDNAFDRLWELIESTPQLLKRVKKHYTANGNKSIELKNGQKIRFRTRTSGGARGFSGDLLVLDEAMDIPEAKLSAVLPILSARPNPQIWYTGSAVDQRIHAEGVVFARVRERGHEGDRRLSWFEWSNDIDIEDVDREYTAEPGHWALANPALGIRISPDFVVDERSAFGAPRGFAVERLGVGDWPRTEDAIDRVIPMMLWEERTDKTSEAKDPVCIGFDITPDRARSSVALCGERSDGLGHIEIVKSAPGTSWVVDLIRELRRTRKVWAFLCDPRGPAGSLIPEVEEAVGKRANGDSLLMEVSTYEHAQACGLFLDAVRDDTVRHQGAIALDDAVGGSATRSVGDAWLWDRKTAGSDISPLVAGTLAFWGNYKRPKKAATVVNLNSL